MSSEKEVYFNPPCAVPHMREREADDRRSSVSSASSSSVLDSIYDHEPYRDNDSSEDRPEVHRYPPRKQRNRKSKPEDGEDAEDDGELLDEEERVGLMMQAKYSKTPSRSRTSACFRLFPGRLAPLAIVLAVVVTILVLVPLLGWLASASRISTLQTQRKHLTEVVIPSHWALPYQSNALTHFRKIKHPLPSGVSKMSSFAAPFQLDFAVGDVSASSNSSSLLPITLDSVLNGTFYAASRGLRWCPEDPDEGVFIKKSTSGDLVVEDVTHLRKDLTGQGEVAKGGGKVTFVEGEAVRDPSTWRKVEYDRFSVSPDMRYVLFFSDRVKQWRHSSFSKVWVHDVKAKKTSQIGFNTTAASIATAAWSSKGYRVSFVEANNLYVIKDANLPNIVTNVTTTGDKNVFNGVPDWVYEEEVLSSDVAHWWSPDGNRLAYFELDEASVKTYSFPIYNPTNTNGKASLYPQSVDMKYPKPGTPNPILSVWVYDVETEIRSELVSPSHSPAGADGVEEHTVDSALRSAGTDVLVTQVNWLNSHNVMLRESNRVSDAMRYMVFDSRNSKKQKGSMTDTIEGTVSRRVTTATSGGWVQTETDVHVVDEASDSTAYIDVIALDEGFRHIAYFSEATQSKPVFLTEGAWEVDKILFVGNKKVYFTAAYPKPAYRHVLSVDIPADIMTAHATSSPTALTDTSKPGFYSASFDPKGNYYIVDNRGPYLPSSKVLSLRDASFELILEDNSDLARTMTRYVRPQIAYYNITTSDGSTISVVEVRPYDFDSSGQTRYPVLINVYGGPASQQVQAVFKMGSWQTYLACSLGYIVVTMDGRGTGFMGRKYRDTVTWRLGEMESKDVIEGAQAIRRLPYVAQSKVGIWGWSYGGFLTAKVVEKNSGAFDLAMSVAPVTRWEFYDTVYTERYMKTPHLNKGGYENSSIHITDGFRNTKFLLAQGSGDDNVHFQNSAHLLDMLQGEKIRDYWFDMFPDSSHSIDRRGANRELYDFLTRFLVYNWGAGGKRLLRYKDHKDLSTIL